MHVVKARQCFKSIKSNAMNDKDTRSEGVCYDDELPVETDDRSCRVSCNTGH